MTDNLKETIDKLNEYASGDEYQRATEDAVELLRQQAQEIEQLKSNTIVDLDEKSGFTFYDPPHGAFIGDIEMLVWLVKNKSLDYWKMKANKNKVCNKCNGTLFVCENHPDQEAHECVYCGGAGMPCECTKKASEK